ncbi:hypothetical protein [Micromonospora sp. NPDC126480]|uniref:hypothetical protein n=1 Tax=Micromonospora sp. NPDC126480 TaxID=3155312 RepID=UPI00331BD3CD
MKWFLRADDRPFNPFGCPSPGQYNRGLPGSRVQPTPETAGPDPNPSLAMVLDAHDRAVDHFWAPAGGQAERHVRAAEESSAPRMLVRQVAPGDLLRSGPAVDAGCQRDEP